MTQQSNKGRLTVDTDEPLVISACLIRQDEGIFIDLSLFPVGGFDRVLDSLFENGVRFSGLDYSLLSGLLYDYDRLMNEHDVDARLKLADDIIPFPAARRALYKGIKVSHAIQRAEYFFEPVSMEVTIDVPVYGEPGEDGIASVIGVMCKRVQQTTQLDLDEFIADMWLKGVRFGLHVAAIADVIARGQSVRLEIASQRDATAGRAAEIEEICKVLHRDNAPKILPNGKADLRRFQNRFLQISAASQLLKKKARVLGRPGYKVNGEIIPPEIPEDNIDLYAMCGPGTRVESQAHEDYIIALYDGFLSWDAVSNVISVTESIENKAGVSLKTTGDLSLAGNNFVEHGEVQEGRVVEGKNMTFYSDVYGDVASQGGFLLFEKNLSGGSAKSYGGDVLSKGRVFNSVIEACTGQVLLKYAESSLILGESVVIDRAVNCDIVASEVQIGIAEGCSIAGKNVHVDTSKACRSKETLISMLLPNVKVLDARIAQLGVEIEACQQQIDAKIQAIAQLNADPEFAKFLSMASNIRRGKVQLNEAQQAGWKSMTSRFARFMHADGTLNSKKKALLASLQDLTLEKCNVQETRGVLFSGLHCAINSVTGDTRVQSMTENLTALHSASPSEIRRTLRVQDVQHKRIFSDDYGSLVWTYEDKF